MKINYSLITRRTFLNTLLGGWLLAFLSGSFLALFKFAFPTLGKEPDFVILKNVDDYMNIPPNSIKPFAWGGKLGIFFKRADGALVALKGVCSHMECNIAYKPEERKFYCPCHKGWFDETGKNIKGPPPKPLEIFEYTLEEGKLIVARKGVKVELPKA
ncbi:MAG: ubiquinol-cytochrome c reductase iron-sulfur subunit [Deltaproteobacteria bacterium]|nr:ubiquinol-cytochrome c reductase iron-sulfur subunit [Deltaproteobacteria bacterium]